jgi:tRNA uridine 5-carboxymethylaminomethyl modification enzyme
VRIKTGTVYLSQTVVLATGTYLNALVHVSDVEYHSGPNGLSASMQLPQSLIDSGVGLRRFKTGTPARVLASTLDYSVTQPQKGDDAITPFSFLNDSIDIDQIDCYLTYTTPATHQIIADNIHKSAPYGGYTTGTGPRYCLSIEDKVDRFPDRLRHQVFLEPEGRYTDEVYVQGMSTSTPEDVQEQFYRTIIGMENAKFTRYGYSIEYDCIDPTVLSASLEHKKVSGLFFAGQICGSSGYEEAAAQGLMAGINAALKVKQMSPCILDRSDAYIGVLIDDLVTKGTNEPYRMMTSRAEYRLILRQDNADLRLTEIGRSIGLVDDTRYARFEAYQLELQAAFEYIKTHHIDGDTIRESFADILEGKIEGRRSIYELLRIPQINISDLIDKDDRLASMSARVLEQIGIQIKYEGYIHKQEDAIAKFKKLEHKLLPIDIDYLSLDGLRNEAKQKLDAIRPDSIGRASRISGVSPADINVLLVHLARLRHQEK